MVDAIQDAPRPLIGSDGSWSVTLVGTTSLTFCCQLQISGYVTVGLVVYYVLLM